MKAFHTSFVALTLFLANASFASNTTPVEITNAWVRAPVPGQQVAVAYLDITSITGGKLVKAETPVARLAEIHSMTVENGVMRMQPIKSLPLPAQQTVKLSPGGYHIMLTGLKQFLKTGNNVPFRLTVEDNAGNQKIVSVDVAVKETSR